MKSILISALLAYSAGVLAQQKPALIPYPQKITVGTQTYVFSKIIPVVGKVSSEEIEIFNHFMPPSHQLKKGNDKTATAYVTFENLSNNKGLHKDFYTIKTQKKGGKTEILIQFTDPKTKFFAFQTVRQLLETSPEGKIPFIEMEDYPKFDYRGMHLDVSRHFFNTEEVKKYLDYLAMYKYDKFHWHLTDDQGWRIEIKKYPKLTSVGAWRNSSQVGAYSDMNFDTKQYGGFYTQEQVKEVVAYAKNLHIDVIPEIEMPGHSLAAIAAYPELSCTGEQIKIKGAWGIEDNILCPTDYTFDFYQNVLDEVMKLFPYQYIHIGGDEAPKEFWKKSSFVQDLMKKLNLKDEHEVQSYFIKRIEKYLNSKGRQIIGWDEILEGGIAPNATIMSWQGIEGGIEAAKSHHKAIMTPGDTNYFDKYQGDPDTEPIAIGGDLRLNKVYAYNPIPDALTAEQAKYIWGTQGNVWTEYIEDFPHVQYMIFPRMMALSEVAWGTADAKQYKDFEKRVIAHFPTLSRLGINYSKSIYEVRGSAKAENGKIVDALSTAKNISNIRYTLDGSMPTWNSSGYKTPLEIAKTTVVKAAYFENGMQLSPVMTQEFFFSKSTGRPITLEKQPNPAYAVGGPDVLVDGIKGSQRNYTKAWLGFQGNDVNATIDLGTPTPISSVSIGALERQASWIYFPKGAKVLLSNDNKNFTEIVSIKGEDIAKSQGNIKLNFPVQTVRFVKVIVENLGKIPEGFQGEGGQAWLFVDEIVVD